MDCRARCWIAGIIAGLLVFIAVGIVGNGGPLAGLMLGLLTTWMLAGILAWGVCAGAGSAAENAAFLEADWSPEPFEPSRRVVAAGGAVVSAGPLADAGPVTAGTARESVTLTPAQGSSVAPTITGGPTDHPQAPATQSETTPPPPAATDVPHAAPGVPPQAGTEPPFPAETVTHPDDMPPNAATPFDARAAKPKADTDVPHVEDVPPPARPLSEGEATVMESLGTASPHADAEAGAGPDDMMGGIIPLQRDGEGGVAADGKGGMAADGTVSADAGAAGGAVHDPAQGDDLTRLKGVGPMLSTWLAEQGVTRFSQIAAWDDADIARFSGMMGGMGHRIRTEDWVGQARALAGAGPAGQGMGGRTE